MLQLIPIDPVNDEHAVLIVQAFNRLFIESGGRADGMGNGDGGANGYSNSGDGWGYGDGYGYGKAGGGGWGNGAKVPKEWQVE